MEFSGLSVETLQLIQETAGKAKGAEGKLSVVKLPEQRGAYALVQPDGSHEIVTPGPGYRQNVLRSLSEVAPFVAATSAESVWYDERGVVAVINDADRRDRATVTLQHTPQFLLLLQLEASRKEATFGQREFIRLLRVDLAYCLDERAKHLLAWARTISINSGAGVQSTLKKDKESLGRSMQAEVLSDAGEMPEEVTVTVRVYDDQQLLVGHEITVAVEYDLQREVFRFVPLPLQLQDALIDEMLRIREKLTQQLTDAGVAEKTRLYYGSPE